MFPFLADAFKLFAIFRGYLFRRVIQFRELTPPQSSLELPSLQIPNHKGHYPSLPCDPTGAGGGPDQAGSEGGDQIKFQTFLAGPEDRGKREKTNGILCLEIMPLVYVCCGGVLTDESLSLNRAKNMN